MQTVIDIKFRTGGKVYYFDPAGIEIHEGDNVIVETQQGPEFTTAVSEVHEVDDEHIVSPLTLKERSQACHGENIPCFEAGQ